MSKYFLNLIGGTFRFIYGKLVRLMFPNKKSFKYKEYLYGPDDGDFIIDGLAHEFNNKLIAIIAICTLVLILLRC
jgi:hypothetical protein